ncbi:MAG: membrane protein insertion efficiency factor YidD [Rhizobiales bacterium]|nr:membrane protein insertion efficiency factor YidD [Hyphomicrobiales bacterium]
MLSAVARSIAKAPIRLYRWTLKPFVGHQCRYLPTCSEYGLEAIERNGAWRGGWQLLARLSRCHPWGSSGHDPVVGLEPGRHRFTPWRYGDWRGPDKGEKDH